MMQKIYCFMYRKTGQATLELMLVMPIFVFFMFFAFDYSRVLVAKWAVMNMARVGTRMAVMQGAQDNPNSKTKLNELKKNSPKDANMAHGICGNKGNDCIAAASAVLAMRDQFISNHSKEFKEPNPYYIFKPTTEYITVETPTEANLARKIKVENNNDKSLRLAVEVCMDVRVQMPFASNGKTIWGDVHNGFMLVCHSYASAHSQIDQKSK